MSVRCKPRDQERDEDAQALARKLMKVLVGYETAAALKAIALVGGRRDRKDGA
jgi:hypothetical protein